MEAFMIIWGIAMFILLVVAITKSSGTHYGSSGYSSSCGDSFSNALSINRALSSLDRESYHTPNIANEVADGIEMAAANIALDAFAIKGIADTFDMLGDLAFGDYTSW